MSERKNIRTGGINTIQIDAARQIHARTVQARIPPSARTVRSTGDNSITSNHMKTTSQFSPPKTSSRHVCNNPNNPPCAHCGTVIIPSPSAKLPLEDNPSITINNWTVSSRKRPILNAVELNDWETKLKGLSALPEMIFGNNYVRIMNTRDEWGIEFNALDALKMVKLEDTGIRVAHSKNWIESKKKQGQQEYLDMDMDESLKITKSYDWTYSTDYRGTTLGDQKKFKIDNEVKIPIDKLSRPDKILFFDDMILFEDELADNGISLLNIKIRVMNERLLLLGRFFLRVDDVLLRVHETRIFVEFDDNLVIREFKKHEGKYNDILAKHHISHSHDPKAALRDSDWVVKHTPLVSRETEIIRF